MLADPDCLFGYRSTRPSLTSLPAVRVYSAALASSYPMNTGQSDPQQRRDYRVYCAKNLDFTHKLSHSRAACTYHNCKLCAMSFSNDINDTPKLTATRTRTPPASLMHARILQQAQHCNLGIAPFAVSNTQPTLTTFNYSPHILTHGHNLLSRVRYIVMT